MASCLDAVFIRHVNDCVTSEASFFTSLAATSQQILSFLKMNFDQIGWQLIKHVYVHWVHEIDANSDSIQLNWFTDSHNVFAMYVRSRCTCTHSRWTHILLTEQSHRFDFFFSFFEIFIFQLRFTKKNFSLAEIVMKKSKVGTLAQGIWGALALDCGCE